MKKLLLCLTIFSCLFVEAQTPSHKEVYKEIVAAGIKYADIVLAQAILESGHFKSKIAKQNNNLFGMRLPMKRETTAIGTKLGYATYLSWKESVKDYKLWQDFLLKRKLNMSRSEYKRYLNKMYSMNQNYAALLNTIINKNKSKYEKDHLDRDSVRNNLTDSMWISSN